MKQNKQTLPILGIRIKFVGLILLLVFSLPSYTQVLFTDDEEPGNWIDATTWAASQPSPLTAAIVDEVTIQGDVYRGGSLDFSITGLGGLTIRGNDGGDTLTVDGNLTFTGANMFLDVEANAVLKVYGDFDTNGSTVLISGEGTIVISGNLILDAGSDYDDSGGFNNLYVDGSISGTSADVAQTQTDGQTFTDLNTNQPILHAEVVTELPVTLVGFDIYTESGGVRLAWATASEENFDFFDIQRSKDGKNYESIGQLAGNGNSTQLINYGFYDSRPYSGISYYRLKAVDYDGSYEIFESKRADVSFGGSQISLYPNPILQHTSGLRVDFQDVLSDKIISIYDALGKMIIEENINEEANFWQLNEGLPRGMYHIKAQFGSQTLVRKFLVN
ncbi:MAG: T9SS type A sorting domain-containing protein [Reichenbachiella sp.]|uniref:T9SS type A sorting domain-containing protein n=1 Tax=Reichenbachiella sp. TaxID=2184521 RepID=UPI003267C898